MLIGFWEEIWILKISVRIAQQLFMEMIAQRCEEVDHISFEFLEAFFWFQVQTYDLYHVQMNSDAASNSTENHMCYPLCPHVIVSDRIRRIHQCLLKKFHKIILFNFYNQHCVKHQRRSKDKQYFFSDSGFAFWQAWLPVSSINRNSARFSLSSRFLSISSHGSENLSSQLLPEMKRSASSYVYTQEIHSIYETIHVLPRRQRNALPRLNFGFIPHNKSRK